MRRRSMNNNDKPPQPNFSGAQPLVLAGIICFVGFVVLMAAWLIAQAITPDGQDPGSTFIVVLCVMVAGLVGYGSYLVREGRRKNSDRKSMQESRDTTKEQDANNLDTQRRLEESQYRVDTGLDEKTSLASPVVEKASECKLKFEYHELTSEERAKEELQEIDEQAKLKEREKSTSTIVCPNCGSSDFIPQERGYSVGWGFLGAMLTGGAAGFLLGAPGSHKIVEVKCLHCGYAWRFGN
jgi:RNase P subunit RPR2